MQPVKAWKQEEEGTDGVEEGDGGVEEVAGQHGGQGKAEQGGGQYHIDGGLDEEAREAGENAEEGHDAEEGEGGVGGNRGEVDEAGGDRLEHLGDVRRSTGIPTRVTAGMRRRLRRRLLATLVYSSKGLIVMCLRSRWSRGLILCWSSFLLSSWDGLQTQGSQEGNPGGGLLWVQCSLRGKELIKRTQVRVGTLPGVILLRVFLACVAHILFSLQSLHKSLVLGGSVVFK